MIPKITRNGVKYISKEQAEKIPVHEKVMEIHTTLIVMYENNLNIQDRYIEKLQKQNRIFFHVIISMIVFYFSSVGVFYANLF